MQFKIEGSVFPMLEIQLTRGESVFTESGGMAWMSQGMRMSTNTRGGLMAGLGRALAGESLFMVNYTCEGNSGRVVFTPEAPGRVLNMTLGANQSLICQKDAFLCGEDSVEMKMYFQKRLGAGIFGGEGFILQKVPGPGEVFLAIPGEVKEYSLAQGDRILVDPGPVSYTHLTLPTN